MIFEKVSFDGLGDRYLIFRLWSEDVSFSQYVGKYGHELPHPMPNIVGVECIRTRRIVSVERVTLTPLVFYILEGPNCGEWETVHGPNTIYCYERQGLEKDPEARLFQLLHYMVRNRTVFADIESVYLLQYLEATYHKERSHPHRKNSKEMYVLEGYSNPNLSPHIRRFINGSRHFELDGPEYQAAIKEMGEN